MTDYLDRIEEKLAELTEQGAHQRLRARRPNWLPRPPAGGPPPPRRRSEAFAFLAAAAVAVAVVAIVVLNVGSGATPHRTSATAAASRQTSSTATVPPGVGGPPPPATSSATTTTSSATPLPSSFSPQSFTAISELTWWLLGSEPCPSGQSGTCTGILRTTDGGRTFAAVQSPSAPSSTYSQLRFADAKDGFAYGPDLYTTHNGGVSWAEISLGGRVTDLAISSNEVYAVVLTGSGNSGRLVESPTGQDQWTTVTAAGEVSGGLWVLGSEVIVQSASGSGYGTDVLVSIDGGGSFGGAPAPSPGLPCDFEAQSPPIIWAHCATGTESGVWYSSEFGKNFVTTQGPPNLPNSALFSAASNTIAVVGYQQLYRTSDAGQSWAPVGPSGIAQWTYLGFTDATHGVAIGYVGSIAPGNERLYYTIDGGQTYHLVPLP